MPKQDVTDDAIAAWEKQKEARSNLPRRQSLRFSKISEPDPISSSVSPGPRRFSRRRRGIIESSSSPPQERRDTDETIAVGAEPEVSNSVPNFPDFKIQVSQHSNFPRDQYTRTRFDPSSQFTQEPLSSQVEEPQSTLQDEPIVITSSPPPNSTDHFTVPDSQESISHPEEPIEKSAEASTPTAASYQEVEESTQLPETQVEVSSAPLPSSAIITDLSSPPPATETNQESLSSEQQAASTPKPTIDSQSPATVSRPRSVSFSKPIELKNWLQSSSQPSQTSVETVNRRLLPAPRKANPPILPAPSPQTQQFNRTHHELSNVSRRRTGDSNLYRYFNRDSPSQGRPTQTSPFGSAISNFQTQIPLNTSTKLAGHPSSNSSSQGKLSVMAEETHDSSCPDNWQGAQNVPSFASPFSGQSLGSTHPISTRNSTQRSATAPVFEAPKVISPPSRSQSNHFLLSGSGRTPNDRNPSVFVVSSVVPNSQHSSQDSFASASRRENPSPTIVSGGALTGSPLHTGVDFASSQLHSVLGQGTPSSYTPPRAKMSAPYNMNTMNEHRGRPAQSSSAYPAITSANLATHRLNYDTSHRMDIDRSPSLIPEQPLHAPLPTIVDQRHLLPQTSPNPTMVKRPYPIDPHAPQIPSKLSSHSAVPLGANVTQLNAPRLGDMEFIVPLNLPARVKDEYDRAVRQCNRAIERVIVPARTPDKAAIDEYEKVFVRLDNVATHIDLDNETTYQEDVAPADEMNWALSCSSKFTFLKYLLNYLRGDNFSIIIIAREGRLLDILERFLIAMEIRYVRPNNATSTTPTQRYTTPLEVTLLYSTNHPEQLQRPAHMIISFDSSINVLGPHIESLRTNPSSKFLLTPVVHLMVFASAEHIRRCIAEVIPKHARLKVEANCISHTRDQVGVLVPEEALPYACAEEVACFLQGGAQSAHYWTLPEIRPIKIQGLDLAELSQESVAGDDSRKRPIVGTHAGIRSRSTDPHSQPDDDLSETKRQRVSPIDDISHISDSIVASQASQIAELQLSLERTTLAKDEALTKNLSEIETYESKLAKKEEQFLEQASAVDEVQGRFESKNRAYHAIRHEKKDLLTTIDKKDQQLTAFETQITALKDERTSLKSELSDSRTQLLNSSNPSIAEIESVKAKNRELVEKNSMLEKKLESLESTFNFTRNAYQDAQSAAAEANAKLSDLEPEVEILRRQASGQAAKLKQIFVDKSVKIHLAEVERLTIQNEELKEQLRRREKGERGRVGVSTRTGSQAPRSPKVVTEGGGLGEGLNAVGAGRMSRQGSRAPNSRPTSPVRGYIGARRGRVLTD